MGLTFMAIIIAIVCVMLMAVILIQNPKGGGIDSTFGGSSANQMFGAARSSDFIENATWWLVGTLFALAIVASWMVDKGGTQVIDVI